MATQNEIRKVLLLLEKSLSANGELELLASQHLENEEKIDNLQKQIQKLLEKQAEIEQNNSDIETDILEIIGETKSQSLRFGKILIDFKVSRETGTTKNSYSYSKIVDALVKQYKVETKVINSLKEKYNNGGKTFTTVNKELNITKESKQLVKESFSNALKTIWLGFRQIFKTLFLNFKKGNDYLEKLIKSTN